MTYERIFKSNYGGGLQTIMIELDYEQDAEAEDIESKLSAKGYGVRVIGSCNGLHTSKVEIHNAKNIKVEDFANEIKALLNEMYHDGFERSHEQYRKAMAKAEAEALENMENDHNHKAECADQYEDLKECGFDTNEYNDLLKY